MISDDTFIARAAAHLYREAAYLPHWVAVDDLVDEITDPNDRGSGGSAESAIRRTAADLRSPVVYTPGTGRSAVSLERGSRGQVDARVRDWIERHDGSELPSGLR